MRSKTITCSSTLLLAFACAAIAAEPSDLLTINVNDLPNGRTQATVHLSPGAGLSIEDALAGQNQLFDLLPIVLFAQKFLNLL